MKSSNTSIFYFIFFLKISLPLFITTQEAKIILNEDESHIWGLDQSTMLNC